MVVLHDPWHQTEGVNEGYVSKIHRYAAYV